MKQINVFIFSAFLIATACQRGTVNVASVNSQSDPNQVSTAHHASDAPTTLTPDSPLSDVFFTLTRSGLYGTGALSGIGFLPETSTSTHGFLYHLGSEAIDGTSTQDLTLTPHGTSELIYVTPDSSAGMSVLQTLNITNFDQKVLTHAKTPQSMALSFDGNQLAWVNTAGEVFFLDLTTQQQLQVDLQNQVAVKIQNIPNSADYLVLTNSNARNLLKISAGKISQTYSTNKVATDFYINPNGSLALIVNTSQVAILDLKLGQLKAIAIPNPLNSFAWLDAQRFLYLTSENEKSIGLALYNLTNSAVTKISDLAISSDDIKKVCLSVSHGNIYYAGPAENASNWSIYKMIPEDPSSWRKNIFASSNDPDTSYICPKVSDL